MIGLKAMILKGKCHRLHLVKGDGEGFIKGVPERGS
jgi:hypothetical protein